MKHLLLPLLLVFAAHAYGQCDQFDKLLKKGDAYLKGAKPNYQEAINAYTAAILACNDRAGEAQKRIASMVNGIDRLRENAVVAEKKAMMAQADTEKARLRSDSLYNVADSERQRAEAVLDKIYFYNNRFGLASALVNDTVITFDQQTYEERITVTTNYLKFGFIDKNLKTRIPFRFIEALPFDYTGYAKVRGGNARHYSIDTSGYKSKSNIDRYYLIDTTGAQYLLATEIGQIAPDITALDLRNKDIKEIPDMVFTQHQLKILLLSGNQITHIPEKIKYLNNLKALFIADNDLVSLPAEIGQLKDLHSLDVSQNRIDSLPSELGKLKKLQLLNLHDNQLKTLTPGLWQLSDLHALDLSRNALSSLPTEIGQLTNLQTLYLHSNQLRYWPAEIGMLNQIQNLDIASNRLIDLPDEIGQMQKLKTLNLGYNNLQRLPAEIGQLKDLYWFDVSGNKIHYLPGEIGQLKNLIELDLSANKLDSLPPEIGQLKRLQAINLHSNNLSTIPPEIGQLKKLQTINLHGNELAGLPAEIGQLNNLETIDIGWNPVTSLPPEIGQLKNLRSLVAGGRITYDPETYEEIPEGGIEALPSGIGQLTNLKTLDLSVQRLGTLPEGLRKMSSLEALNLQNNPFSGEYIEELRRDMPRCKILWEQSPGINLMREEALRAERGAASAFYSGNYHLAESLTQGQIATLRKLCNRTPNNCNRDLGKALYSYSWFALFSRQPSKAVEAAQEGFQLGQNAGIRTNEAHGYLLNDQWDKAQTVYLAIKSEYADTIWKDLQDLARAGIRHPDMVKAAELVLDRKLDAAEHALITGK
jgi:Leucine-rich repeat (LRR) protein